jgi:hypothetical protein
VPLATLTSACLSDGGTSFVPDEQTLYINYDLIATSYTGWPFSEIQKLTNRQRRYWLDMIRWKRDRVRV